MSARQARSMSGLDYLKAIARGEIPPPPIAELLQLRLEELDSGRAVFSVEPAEFHYNPIGVVHGGLAATILDSAMGCAVHTLLSAGTGYTTLDIHVNFVRPLTADTGKVKCEATVIHAGSRIATAEGRLVDASGKLYAHATSTLLIIQGTTNP
jgi:uncharacterized protein (TIGR00369 family)